MADKPHITIAIRAEGEMINAYYTDIASDDRRILMGSLRRTIADNDRRQFEIFKKLMEGALGSMLKDITGTRPAFREEKPAQLGVGAGPYPKDVKQCDGCEADIVWMRTKKAKHMPVNVIPTDANFRGPTAGELRYKHGEHQPHWATCPCAGEFRKGRSN